MAEQRELHLLAVFVHGALCGLHALGLLYNVRRRNRFDVVAHGTALLYSIRATRHHVREVR